MKYTTDHLKLSVRERYRLAEPTIRTALTGASFVVCLLLISRLLNPAPAPAAPVGTIVPRQPIVVIQKETAIPQPTWTPAPTSEPEMIYITLPTPEPQVVYVESAPVTSPDGSGAAEAAQPVEDIAPTPAAPVYDVQAERQANIQAHYVDIPTREPMQSDDVTADWARQQWATEHCLGSGAAQVCH